MRYTWSCISVGTLRAVSVVVDAMLMVAESVAQHHTTYSLQSPKRSAASSGYAFVPFFIEWLGAW